MKKHFFIEIVESETAFEGFLDMNTNASIEYGMLPKHPDQTEIKHAREEVASYIDTKENNLILLARANDEAKTHVGFIWMAERDGREAWYFGSQPAWIYNIWIKPDFRRKGLATYLLRAGIAWAADMGFQKLGLHVFGNNTPAIKLYRQCGFEAAYAYHQKDFETPPEPINHPFSLQTRPPEKTYPDLQAIEREIFNKTAYQLGNPSKDEFETRFKNWFGEFDFSQERFMVMEARDKYENMISYLWGYRSKADLGDQTYFWLQGLYARPDADEQAMRILLSALEKALDAENIHTIRTNIQHPSALDTLKQIGFHQSNLFMFHPTELDEK